MTKHARNIVAIVRKGHGLAEAPKSTARIRLNPPISVLLEKRPREARACVEISGESELRYRVVCD